MNNTVKRLTTSAILIALATLLSFARLFQYPFGGSINLCAMLPICIIAYKYGFRWGFLSGLVFGFIQMLTGGMIGNPWAMEYWDYILMLALDYFIAYAFLSLACVTKGRFKNESAGFAVGICIAASARYLMHVLSGYILFSSYATRFFERNFEGAFGTWVLDNISGTALSLFYAFFYNALYMVPNTVITVIMGLLLFSSQAGKLWREVKV
jgi:thiamine transporter